MYTLDQIHCFIAVAEELHFGKAAERLHITQPPLSRQIQRLEREIEFKLFDRSSSGVSLTPAGVSFLNESYRLLERVKTAPRKGKLIAEGRVGLIRIGYTAISGYSVLGKLLTSIRGHLPDIQVELSERVTSFQIESIQNHSLDLGLARPPFTGEGILSRPIHADSMTVVVPKGHPLAENANSTTLEQIHDYPLIMYSPKDAEYFHDLLTKDFGIDPALGEYQVTDAATIVALVAQDHGIAVVPSSTKVLGRSDVEYLDIASPKNTTVELHAVWHSDSTNPVLQHIPSILSDFTEQTMKY